MEKKLHIGIIGAGIAGLAAAVRMAVRGHQVTVYEARAQAGGKLDQLKLGGYRFDAGPSLFTMPHYVDELFRLAGEAPRPHFSYDRLPVVCNYFWEDGTRLPAPADAGRFAHEAGDALGVDPRRIRTFLEASRQKYERTGRIFLEKSLHRVDTWLSRSVLRALAALPSYDLMQSMHRVHKRELQHPKLVQLFNRFATYNGSNPYKAPGLLTIIPHFEHGIGAYYPRGGMYRIPQSIYELARRLGVRFHFNSPVERILVKDKRACGLQVQGEPRYFDRIISNMDVFFTYRKLLPDEKHPERILRQEKSTSALIFYWGVGRSFPELDLHNIFFTEDYRREFEELSAGRVYSDPTVYVNISSKADPADAPAGRENWFVMVNVPYDSGQNWAALRTEVRRDTLAKLSRMLGRSIEPLIEEEDSLDPLRIESRTGSHLGALYGTSSNNRMAAFLRHANFSRRIRDLYFCGGSVHPGGGIPLCLLSARIVDELMHGAPADVIPAATTLKPSWNSHTP